MLRLNSALFSLAAQFTGKYVPYQGVSFFPHAGGCLVAASDRGAGTFLGFDPQGAADETAVILPEKSLVAACNGIKTATRELQIDGDTALVITSNKTTSSAKEFRVTRSSQPAVPFRELMARVVETWGQTPEVSTTAGRYDAALLAKAMRAMGTELDGLVLSSYHGGPLRLQGERLQVVVFLMPQTAEPLPAVPDWLTTYARSA